MALGFSMLGDLPVLFMQFASVVDIPTLMDDFERFGVFDYLLPFLLIFAIIFGVLTSTNILGGSKGINLIISLVIAILALRLEFVSIFFTELFPRFAMGLVSIIIMVILVGLFIPPEAMKGWYIAFGIIGSLIALIVIVQTFGVFNYFGSYFWQEYMSTILIWGFLIGGIIGIFMGAKKPGNDVWKTPIGKIRADFG